MTPQERREATAALVGILYGVAVTQIVVWVAVSLMFAREHARWIWIAAVVISSPLIVMGFLVEASEDDEDGDE